MTEFRQRYQLGQYHGPKHQYGFGLTECMVAALILMAGALAVSASFRLWHQKIGHLAMNRHLYSLASQLETQLHPAFYSASVQQQAALFAAPQSAGNILATQLSGQPDQSHISQSVSASVQIYNTELLTATDTMQLSATTTSNASGTALAVFEMHISQSAYQQSLDSVISVSVIRTDGLTYPDTFEFNSDYSF